MLDVSLSARLPNFQLSVAFTAQQGTTTVLLGESGAGKTTVLRLLAGLMRPEQGHIALAEQTFFDSTRHIAIPPQERPFGYVFQDYVLFPHLSVFENIAFGLRAQHFPRATINQRVEEALSLLALDGLAQRRPTQLSGGQQQRVAIARALALQPRLLLLDEPLAALDVQTRREVRQELRRLLSKLALTTILVTHHYVEALLFGQQILVLDSGQVIQKGDQQELRESPRSAYVAELVGVNFFRGQIVGYEAEQMCIIQLPANGLASRTELVGALRERAPGEQVPEIGTAVYLIVDPRSVTLHTMSPEGSARNVLRGEILHLLPLSSSTPESASSHTATNNPTAEASQPLVRPQPGRVRVSIRPELAPHLPPLTAEITAASANRLGLSEGRTVFATFKASEAWAYV
jgi:molybdate transport system ATP-binding protein